MTIDRGRRVGKAGEDAALYYLGRALGGHISTPVPDRGLDGIVEFPSGTPDSDPLHIGVQVKTGFSYVKKISTGWEFDRLDRNRLRQWQRSRLPVILVWVNPERDGQIYWTIVPRKLKRNRLFIRESHRVTPVTKFDLSLDLAPFDSPKLRPAVELLAPPLSAGIRDVAKATYKKNNEGG